MCHPDFKPPTITDDSPAPRLTCEYFLSRLKDFTDEGANTIQTGSPKVLKLDADFIPKNLAERPQALAQPVPSFGPFDVVGSGIARSSVPCSDISARLVEIKSGTGPAMGNEPRVVGVCWNAQDSSDPAQDFADGGMDILVMFSLPGAHADFAATDSHQHSFDYLWLYPYWWMNYFVLPTERGGLSPPHKVDYPPAGGEQDPLVFLGGGGRWRAGSGVAHQIAATGRPLMGLFPVPGIHTQATGEWNNSEGFSEFVYELIAMLRRQAGDYRPLERGDHLKQIGVSGHSRSCTDAVMPTAKAWFRGPLGQHLADVILLDPPEGSHGGLTADLMSWAAQRGSGSPINVCMATKSSKYVTSLGGAVPDESTCVKQGPLTTTSHPAPIRFLYVPGVVWSGQWDSLLGRARKTEYAMKWTTDDSHACLLYFGVFPALSDSPLGT
jgi:hypothetical protein